MMIVGIEINDVAYSDRCFSNPLDGNPGIGGADYILLQLAVCLHNFYSDIRVIIFHTGENNTYPNGIELIQLTPNLEEICENKVDIYIANAYARDNSWYEFFEKNKVKLILRATNFPTAKKLTQYNNYSCIKRIVFLGGQEYDLYLDDDIINKSCIIENMHKEIEASDRRVRGDKKTVTYMGALVPQKGFAFLAENWKKILEEVPDAELNVIGSGKLYNSNSVLGNYGFASKEYEEQFIPYLLDESGNILSSVHFLGRLQGEKIKEILRETMVGVPNPIGVTETFCNCAVEMQSMGVPVVTIAGYSFFDVVVNNKGGYLYKKEEDFAKYIIRLLKDKELNIKMGEYAKKSSERFLIEKIMPKWKNTIEEVYQDIPAKYLGHHGHILYEKKYITLINRYLRFSLKLKRLRSRRGETG